MILIGNKIHRNDSIQPGTLVLFDNDKLKTIIPKIKNLKNVTQLCLAGNRLTELPEEMKEWPSLTGLVFGDSPARPALIYELTQLKKLSMPGVKSSPLSKKIGNLTGLTELSLFANRLSELPNSIGKLINLEVLNLSSNQLKIVPPQIRQLKKLSSLYLSYNPITDLPDWLSEFKHLKHFTSPAAGDQVNRETARHLKEQEKKFLPHISS